MRRRKAARTAPDWPFPELVGAADDGGESSLLDVVDTVLNKGAAINGDLVLGVANVDLIYAKLSVLLAALDRVERRPSASRRRSERRARKRPTARKPGKRR